MSEVSATNWYLEHAKLSGSFSTRVVEDPTHMAEITRSIKQSFVARENMTTAARRLVEEDLVIRDESIIRQDIEKVIDNARQLYRLSDDAMGFREFQQKVDRMVEGIDLGTLKTEELQVAYQKVLNLATDASSEQFEGAVRYAIEEKAKYNAMRIAQSEWTRAYRQAFIADVNHDPDAVGWRWVLADDHDPESNCDCEDYANSDFYGMGDGVYPADVEPPFTHPNCWCDCEAVYRGESENDDADTNDFDPSINEDIDQLETVPDDIGDFYDALHGEP